MKILLAVASMAAVAAIGTLGVSKSNAAAKCRPRPVVAASQYGRVLRCGDDLTLRSADGRSKYLGLRYEEPGTAGTGAGGIRSILVDGRWLAYERSALGRDPTYWSIYLVDMRTRRTVRTAGTGVVPPDRRSSGNEGIGATTDLALRGRNVAWIVRDEYSQTPRWEVWVMTGEGARRLDEGAEVEPGSLALGTRFVYWTRAGAPMRAAVS